MNELTPLDEAIDTVVNLSRADQQRTIVKRLREQAGAFRAEASRVGAASACAIKAQALEEFANRLEAELA